jgi:hypothetical protein
MEKRVRIGYPSDVSDEEWAFVAPYLALCREDSEQRDYSLRAVFNGLRNIVRTGGQWPLHAQRSASMNSRVSTDATLDPGPMFRDHGGGSAYAVARVFRAQGAADGDDPG